MTRITLLTTANCDLCEHAKRVLGRVSADVPLEVVELDVSTEEGRAIAAQAGVAFPPGVLVDDEPFSYGRLSERKLRRLLRRRSSRPPPSSPIG